MTMALLGGLFAATTLQAQVNIYICGSTAFRASAWRSITNLYGSGLVAQNPGGIANTNNSGATLCTLTGTMAALGGQTVNVYLSWNGSAQGVHNLTHNDNILFLTNDFANDTAATNADVLHTPDISFSDVYQITTPYTTPSLVDTNVAVLPFTWVRSANAPTTLANLTSQQYHASIANGFNELSLFTGNNNDDATNIFFCGRNKDSGSRLVAIADSNATGSPNVYQVVGGLWTLYSTSFSANGVNYGTGFTSGGSEAATLTNLASNGYAVGYEGYSDARTVVAGNGQIIAYNGQFPFNGWSAAANGGTLPVFPDFTPIFKGQYSLWSYEHMFVRSTASSPIPTFYSAMVPAVDNDLSNVEANASSSLPVIGIRLSEMKVIRTADGGPITTP